MHFMFLILAFLLGAVLWGFFHSNPQGVGRRSLLACNLVILAAAVVLSLGAAIPFYGDAIAAKPDHKAIAVYLSIMVGGSGFMIVVAVGGLIRNLFLFPLSRRSPA
jgi:hypothetical protein